MDIDSSRIDYYGLLETRHHGRHSMDIDSLRTDNRVNFSEPDSMARNLSQIEPSGTDIHMDSSRLTTEIYL